MVQPKKRLSKILNLKWPAAAGLLLFAAYLFQLNFLAYGMYVILGILILSYAMTHAWLGGLEVMRKVDREHAWIGKPVNVFVEVKNNNPWPVPWLFVEETLPQHFPVEGEKVKITSLKPQGSICLLYNVKFTERGYYQVGPLIMETGDVFGLYRKFKIGGARDYVTVYPKVIPVGEYQVGSRRPMGEVRFANKIYEDPTRVSGIRQYVPGDPLKLIHWKSTAKTTMLQTKTVDPSTVRGAIIVLDFHETSYEGKHSGKTSELAVTTASSLAFFLGRSGEQVGFFTNGRDAADKSKWEASEDLSETAGEAREIAAGEKDSDRLRPLWVPTRRSPNQSLRILESLARVQLTDGLLIEELLVKETREMSRDVGMIVITGRISDSLSLGLRQMIHLGFAVTLVFVGEATINIEEEKSLLALGLNVVLIRKEEHIKNVVPSMVIG